MPILCVAFNILLAMSTSYKVNAIAYRYAIEKSDTASINDQHSINSGGSNESIVSKKVINHVRHQHQQIIGNVHILTNIDIANLITILNESVATGGQSTSASITPGKMMTRILYVSNQAFIN